jgi:SAM-dependent methyltransferase
VFATPEQLRGFLNNADPWADLRIQCLASHISLRGVSVLDVGCGRGEFLYLLQKLGADVTGVELDANAACIARQIGVREVHNKYLDRVDFETPFDVVVLNDVIEHPLKPIALLADVRKVLKDSGLLLIWTPSGDAPNTDPEKITFRVDLEHMQYLSTRTIQMIAQSGWEILHLETLGFPNLDGMSTPARSGLGLRGAIKRVLRNVPGLTRLRNLRNSLLLTRKERTGNYHLLTILRKRLQ